MNNYPPKILTLVTPPASEPLTLAEVKLFLRVDGSDEDSVINDLIAVARETAESWMRVSLITQTWQLEQQFIVSNPVKLALGPIQSIVQVDVNYNGQLSTLTTDQYEISADYREINIAETVTADRVIIQFVAGYGDTISDIPAAIRQGMLHQISYLFHNRESGQLITEQAQQLWSKYRDMTL